MSESCKPPKTKVRAYLTQALHAPRSHLDQARRRDRTDGLRRPMGAGHAGRQPARNERLLPAAGRAHAALRQGRAPDHPARRARPPHPAGRLHAAGDAVGRRHAHAHPDMPADRSAAVSMNGSGFDYWRLKLRAMAWLVLGRMEAAEAEFSALLRRWPQDAYGL